MTENPRSVWLFRYAVLCAVCTLVLICLGGIVTSKGVGMAVPDWPTSFGYNMFWLPLEQWWGIGGVHDEHLHRLVASTVGALTVLLALWIQFREKRPWLRRLGWGAVALVVTQGLLGGLRVVLDKHTLLNSTGGVWFGIAHATLGQLFFATVSSIAFFLSRMWNSLAAVGSDWVPAGLKRLSHLMVVGFVIQLLIAAAMRHQHAGLAIPDFPLAHGQIWPATDPESMGRYNQRRIGPVNEAEVTPFQIQLQMAHRVVAVLLVTGVVVLGGRLIRRGGVHASLGYLWIGLISVQFFLGAATIWTNKSADVATAHVAVGAVSLMTGILILICLRVRASQGQFSEVGPCPQSAEFLKPASTRA